MLQTDIKMTVNEMIAWLKYLEDNAYNWHFNEKVLGIDVNIFEDTCAEIREYLESTKEKAGRWVKQKGGGFTPGGNPVYECSECGWVFGSHMITPNYSYCPNCGSKMKHNGET